MNWTLLTEKLPPHFGFFLTTVEMKDGEAPPVSCIAAEYWDGKWTWCGGDTGLDNVIAWAPMPDPYLGPTGTEHAATMTETPRCNPDNAISRLAPFPGFPDYKISTEPPCTMDSDCECEADKAIYSPQRGR